MKKPTLFVLPLFFLFNSDFRAIGQQVPDTAYEFAIYQAAYQNGEGSLIFIDEAHNNFHTKDGGFFAFSKLLQQDGYQVKGLKKAITNSDVLNGYKILVIVNSLNASNSSNWVLPTPSAFSKDEITIIKRWVENGGSLLLIADHMPFAGAAYELGKAFGFELINGFAFTGEQTWPPSVFSRRDKTLGESIIVNGIRDYEKIDSVATFTGSAFSAPAEAIPVFSFLEDHYALLPDTAWSFNAKTPRQSLKGFQQGALLNFGKGKVAFFGEAAMFTAQIANGNFKVGINSESALQNAQFALNLIHWLDGVKEYSGSEVKEITSVTVPFILDHNRMLVEAEFQRKDGSWRKALLWVDTGNPEFLISKSFARDMGIGIDTGIAKQEISPPANVRIGGLSINFNGVKSYISIGVPWLFNTMHNDGNLPSMVLKNYHIIFDYPSGQLTIAEPGILKPRGIRSPATINPANGIIQMDAIIDGENYSFALDNGASFSFIPDDLEIKLSRKHPDWQNCKGAVGCANIWGWWPKEEAWPLLRIPEIQWGTLNIRNVGIGGLPPFFTGGTDLATRYSKKSLRPVNGFLGPNAFKEYRVEIVFADSALYFEKGDEADVHDMDIVGLTLKPLVDGRYEIIGIASKEGKPVTEGIEAGDILLRVGDLQTTGATMGTVIDALRGKPGDIRILKIDRNGQSFNVEARVKRIL
jgi:hypothetical protein